MAGGDKKTLNIFSTLAKNSVKFFYKPLHKGFSLLFATAPTTTATSATRPLKNEKKSAIRCCKRLREMVYYR